MEPGLLGVEHEFVVSSASGVVDFRGVIHGLGLGQRNLDPADPSAYRLSSGAAVTCDGAEAEVALPPITLGPGFAAEAAHLAKAEELALAARLSHEVTLTGYSTHLSVSVPDRDTRAVCEQYARTFAAAMILLGGRRDSPGLLIRPRPGRVELGVEYLASDQLVAAALFAVATVRACLARVRGEERDLPAELEVRVEPAVERFGWYVDRAAFGSDLLAGGRSALVRCVNGDLTTASAHLEACWRLARPVVEPLASPEELAVTDETIGGDRPLPSERVVDGPVRTSQPALSLGRVYGSALPPRRRPSFEVAPVMLSWELAIFLIVDGRRRRRAFAAVPGPELGPFLVALDSGALDREIERFLMRPRATLSLRSWSEVEGVGLYDAIGARVGLVRPEFRLDGHPASGSGPDQRLRWIASRGRKPRWPRLLPIPRAGARSSLSDPAPSAAPWADNNAIGRGAFATGTGPDA